MSNTAPLTEDQKQLILEDVRDWFSKYPEPVKPIISDISDQIPHGKVVCDRRLVSPGKAYFWAKVDNQPDEITERIRKRMNVPEPYNNLLVGFLVFAVRQYAHKYMFRD